MHRVLIAIAVAIALVAAACRPTPVAEPTSPSPGSTATPTPPVAASPSPAGTATAAPTPRITDATLARFLQPHVAGWRPADTTVMVEEHVTRPNGDRETTYVAVPADGRPAVRLVTSKNAGLAAARPDGSALVLALGVLDAPPTSRLALWDARTGDARWLVGEERGAGWNNPVWSADGAFVYAGRFRSPAGADQFGTDLGIWRMRPDGGDLRQVIAGRPAGALPPTVSVPALVTPENILVWGHGYEGVSVEIRDLGTGRTASYGGVASLTSWRPTAPRALVVGCSGTGCRGLVLWDDQTGARRTLVGDTIEVNGADWDTSGTKVVVSARSDPAGTLDLYVMEGSGDLARTKLVGTQAARWPLWLRAGIVYAVGDEKINIVPPSGGAPKTLLASSGGLLFIRGFVKP